MMVHTLFFGELQVEDANVITFAQGIPGFEDLTTFTLVQPDNSVPFSYMQSIQDGELAFLVTDPFLFFKDYDFSLPDAALQELKIAQREDVQVWSVVTVNDDYSKITVNLLAPIILNLTSKLAKQIILHDSGYHVKHELILSELDESTHVKG
ncbi:flagellar assembly protein FliW [Paenibacillus roseipurpureus]|uniref:Flagellar assembly factor FliW n=1 Tax=Paenibacillus roseopurpureus TaxID=2918901 RepID=A0AA96LRG6_9BACL|nr:flagellar assembly protein FliW [Paenibacillus sp. MBLB1832]WNR44694.1 flagellar assembly protein FliW [Paenibacillus sp. MBLB1832]